MLGDDHSLMGGSDDTWSWWIVGLWDWTPFHVVLYPCTRPLDVGIYCGILLLLGVHPM